MEILSMIMAVFAVLGALDLMLGNRFGLGAEFKKGLFMFGELSLSMVGMIVLSPLIAQLLAAPLLQLYEVLHIDPSSFIGCLLANDMGGADLAKRLAIDTQIGSFNGLIVASMMGATVSFTLPFIMGTTQKSRRDSIFLGIICGICTIPIGCFTSGLCCGIPILTLLLNMTPLLVLSVFCCIGLLKFRRVSLKIFHIIGIIIRSIVILGIAIGIFEYLTGIDAVPYTAPIEDGVTVIFSIVAVMTGAFPMIYIITLLLKKPLHFFGNKTGLNEKSLIGFLSTLATSVTTFGMMDKMDDRGVTLNSAFAVAAAFTFADHLAFTMAYDRSYVWIMILGKLTAGFSAILVAAVVTRKVEAQLQPVKYK